MLVGSINELKKVLNKEESVMVSGYYSPGDGGGGIFFWDPDSQLTDNGGTVIAQEHQDNPGRWIRYREDNTINVKWFGAKGNGQTDDYQAIQVAADSTVKGDRLLIPNGEYAVSKRVHIETMDLIFQGEGALVPYGDNQDYLIEFIRPPRYPVDQDAYIYQGRFRVDRLKIRGRDKCRGVFIAHVDQTMFSNFNIEGTRGTAVKIHNSRHNVFMNTCIHRCRGNGEAILDIYQMSKKPDPYGGAWQGAPGLVDRNVYICFYSLKIEVCEAETYVDIGTEDPDTPYISQSTGDIRFIDCVFHGIIRDYIEPHWEGTYKMNLGMREVPWNIYNYKLPVNVSMIKLRSVNTVQFSQCHFTFGSTTGTLLQIGEDGKPANNTKLIGCSFGLGARLPDGANIEDNRIMSINNANEVELMLCVLPQNNSHTLISGRDVNKVKIYK